MLIPDEIMQVEEMLVKKLKIEIKLQKGERIGGVDIVAALTLNEKSISESKATIDFVQGT